MKEVHGISDATKRSDHVDVLVRDGDTRVGLQADSTLVWLSKERAKFIADLLIKSAGRVGAKQTGNEVVQVTP